MRAYDKDGDKGVYLLPNLVGRYIFSSSSFCRPFFKMAATNARHWCGAVNLRSKQSRFYLYLCVKLLACKSNSYSCKQILWLYIPTFGYIKCPFIRISPEFKDGLHMISFFEFQCWHIHDRHLLCHVIKVGYHSEMNKCYSLIIWDFISFYSLKQKGSRCKQNESNCRGVPRENLKDEAPWD